MKNQEPSKPSVTCKDGYQQNAKATKPQDQTHTFQLQHEKTPPKLLEL